jgi:hypothetical protein
LRLLGRARVLRKGHYNELSTLALFWFGAEVRGVLQLRIEMAKGKIFMIAVSTSYGVGLVVSPALVLPDPLPH